MWQVKLALWASRAFKWLKSLPWYVWTHAGLVAVLLFVAADRADWKETALGYKATIDNIRAAQKKADDEAKADAARKNKANVDNSKGTLNARNDAVAGAGRVVSSLRLRIADLERAARARNQAGPGGPAGGPAEEVDYRLSLTDELALREQAEACRIDRDALIDWEIRRLAIEGVVIDPTTGEPIP
jgi:hypothetical protein